MNDWSLHIDESGKFEQATDNVAVGGLFIPSGYAPQIARKVSRELVTALPHVPWPPHRWLVERPIAHLGWHAVSNFRYVSEARRAAHEHAAALLDAQCRGQWRELRERLLRLEAEPGPALLSSLSTTLGRWPGRTAVADEARESNARVRQCIQRLSTEDAAGMGVRLVFSGEELLASATPMDRRYAQLLGAVIERAIDGILTVGPPGDHRLHLEVMRRPRSNLDESAIRSLAGPPRTRNGVQVQVVGVSFRDRIKKSETGDLKGHSLPWPLVCDWIAYGTRHALQAAGGWQGVEKYLAADVGIPSSTPDGLPLAASVGVASNDSRTARQTGLQPPKPPKAIRGWAADTMNAWGKVPW